MSFIQWEESYSVKNHELDQQHKECIDIINTLHRFLIGGSIENYSDNINNTLNRMIKYCLEHFDYEEKVMENVSFPDLVNHQKLHKNFLQELKKLKLDIKNRRLVLGSEVMKYLKNWLHEHVLNEDAKYKEYLIK